MEERIRFHDRLWQWFENHSETHYALVWLGLVSFFDGFISPIPTELYLIALMVARPARWWQYLIVTSLGALGGAMVGYVIGNALFQAVGVPLIRFYHLQTAFVYARQLLHGHTFLVMALIPFIIPIPQKVFIYTAGFLGVHFIPYALGYFVGQTMRLAIVLYLAGRYGRRVFDTLKEYLLVIGIAIVSIILIYGIVHLYHLPL